MWLFKILLIFFTDVTLYKMKLFYSALLCVFRWLPKKGGGGINRHKMQLFLWIKSIRNNFTYCLLTTALKPKRNKMSVEALYYIFHQTHVKNHFHTWVGFRYAFKIGSTLVATSVREMSHSSKEMGLSSFPLIFVTLLLTFLFEWTAWIKET